MLLEETIRVGEETWGVPLGTGRAGLFHREVGGGRRREGSACRPGLRATNLAARSDSVAGSPSSLPRPGTLSCGSLAGGELGKRGNPLLQPQILTPPGREVLLRHLRSPGLGEQERRMGQ